jgi:hypothetical protein
MSAWGTAFGFAWGDAWGTFEETSVSSENVVYPASGLDYRWRQRQQRRKQQQRDEEVILLLH